MTQPRRTRLRWMRRVAIVLAVAPLFQLSACGTGLLEVMRTSVNQAPSAFYQTLNGLVLFPIQLLLGGGRGGSGGGTGGLGGSSGFGGSNTGF